ncbi:MAG: rhodanese-like domain-containing protein [Pseudomonadota bacterium]|nr:rhodanese-like domain-containing protein [Pseudomonadota bacterium]
MTQTAADLVADALRQIREISSQAFTAHPANGILIDVREPAEYDSGHIAGAVNIPCGVLEFQVDPHPAVANVGDPALSHRDQSIVVYCRTGGRSALAALSLQQLGFKDVRSIAGGISDWTVGGLPLTMH